MIIEVDKIKALLESSATAYDIELKTGVSRSMVGNYRKDPDRIMKMSLENAVKLIEYYEEEMKMDYHKELVELEKKSGYTNFPHVTVYENKEDFLTRNSENMGDEKEVKETYDFLKEEHDYLEDDGPVYAIDRGNGTPVYYNDAKEAYEAF